MIPPERVAAPRDSKVLPRWRFLTPLDGNEYYYQVLLLNVPFRSEGELISDPNASGTFKEECFLRNLVRQEEDALDALEKAFRRNFSIYIYRMAKMLILQNVEAQEAVNRKLRDWRRQPRRRLTGSRCALINRERPDLFLGRCSGRHGKVGSPEVAGTQSSECRER